MPFWIIKLKKYPVKSFPVEILRETSSWRTTMVDSVLRSLNYLEWEEKFLKEKPYMIISHFPHVPAERLTNIKFSPHPAEKIQNLRGHELLRSKIVLQQGVRLRSIWVRYQWCASTLLPPSKRTVIMYNACCTLWLFEKHCAVRLLPHHFHFPRCYNLAVYHKRIMIQAAAEPWCIQVEHARAGKRDCTHP